MQSITNSPDISSLHILARYNLDLIEPSVTLLNQSVGGNLANCQYIAILTDPYGVEYHSGDFATPDKTGNWTEWTVPARLTQVQGHLPWNGEWIVEVKVKDSEGNIYSDRLSRVICRPNGNVDGQGNNFGVAKVSALTQCSVAKLHVEDKTNYSYQGSIGNTISNIMKLIYPADATNMQPEAFIQEDVAHALIPLYFNGDGYQLLLDTIKDYYDQKGTIVRVKYKFKQVFKVRCGADLCDLNCIIASFQKRIAEEGCSAEERNRLNTIIAKATQAIIGILQPLCGIEVATIIREIKAMAGEDCGCGDNIDGLNAGIAYNSCAAPANLRVQWNEAANSIKVDWDTIEGAIDKLTIDALNYKRNNVTPPIWVNCPANVLMTIRVNRLCSDGTTTMREMLFQSLFNNIGLPLIIIEHPKTQTINVGESVALKVTATGHGPMSYQWYKDGIAITGATGQIYTISSVSLNDAAIYTAKVTDNDGTEATSNEGVLSVNTVLRILQHPVSQGVNVGGSATFSVVAVGDNPLTYQWYKGNVAIPGATSSTYTIPSAGLADAAQYRVLVGDDNGETLYSSYAGLTINQLVQIITHPATQGVNQGQNVTLTVVATGDNPLSYQWMKEGVNIPGATGQNYSINSITQDHAGGYTVLVTDVNGDTATSNVAFITVNQGVIITLQPVSQGVNLAESVTFTVAAIGDNPLSYQWRKNGIAIPGATSSSFSVYGAGLGDVAGYTVLVTDANGDTAISAVANLTVNQLVVITTQPVSQTVNVGAAVNLTVTATGDNPLSYQWMKNGVNITGATGQSYSIPSAQLGNAGAYTVKVTDANGDHATSNAANLIVNEPVGVGQITVRWGANYNQNAFDNETAILAMPFTANYQSGAPAYADYTSFDGPIFLFYAEPVTHPVRSNWYVNALSKGTIGDPDNDTFVYKTVGQFRLYYTTYRTQQKDGQVQFIYTQP